MTLLLILVLYICPIHCWDKLNAFHPWTIWELQHHHPLWSSKQTGHKSEAQTCMQDVLPHIYADWFVNCTPARLIHRPQENAIKVGCRAIIPIAWITTVALKKGLMIGTIIWEYYTDNHWCLWRLMWLQFLGLPIFHPGHCDQFYENYSDARRWWKQSKLSHGASTSPRAQHGLKTNMATITVEFNQALFMEKAQNCQCV